MTVFFISSEVNFLLDWIFEGIINWIASIVTAVMDAVSGIFLNALGTDMTTMEEYFPFVKTAFEIMQYTAWCLLFLITIWQLFKTYAGPMTEAENPWHLLVRSAFFAFLIGYAKPIFTIALNIARAPYTALMDVSVFGSFTFAGIENMLLNGLITLLGIISVVGLLLMIIMMLILGWNYFKTLLLVVERYILVGVLCYTSPLAFAMGGSKATNKVFQSWCRMVGSQLLLLVMNVWFLRGFNTSVAQFVVNGGALSTGQGNIFLWMFSALAFLKIAQKFESILASLGLTIAQTGGGMGLEMMMAARVLGGFGKGMSKTAGSSFGGGAAGRTAAGATTMGATGGGAMSGFASKFKGNSYVRDAVVDGGSRMGAGGGVGFVGRAFGGMAAKTGATLTGESISSVAARHPSVSGNIGGNIADRSLGNYMPHMSGKRLSGTQITGGQISTTAVGANGKQANVQMYNAALYDKPDAPHSVVKASDGSTWYQTATGAGMSDFYSPATSFNGDISEVAQVKESFPDLAEGTMLRSVDDGVMEAAYPDGSNGMMYNSALYQEPEAPHDTITSSDGVGWYAMKPNAEMPNFETGEIPEGVGSGIDTSEFVDGMNAKGVPFDNNAYESADFADIDETSTLSGGSIQNVDFGSGTDNANGITIDGDVPDNSAINENTTLPGGSTQNADSVSGINNVNGIPVDENISDMSDIRENTTLPGGSGSVSPTDNANGIKVNENISDTSNIHENTTLPGGSGFVSTADNANGIKINENVSDASDIRENTTLPGGSGSTSATVNDENINGNVSDGSVINNNAILPDNFGSTSGADNSKVIKTDGNIPETSDIRDNSLLPGGSINTPDSISATNGNIPETGVIRENTKIPNSKDSGVIYDSGDTADGSNAILMNSNYKETGSLHETSTISGSGSTETVIPNESGSSESVDSSGGVSIMSNNLGNYNETIAPQTQTGSSLSGGSGVQPVIQQPDMVQIRFDPAAATEYNQAQFQQFMPGYEQQIANINASRQNEGMLEIRHPDGTGTALYDQTMYKMPRGDHKVYEDNNAGKWYAVQGTPTVERRPIYENGKVVYDGAEMRTENVEGMRYKTTPEKFTEPKKRDTNDSKPPRKKQ